MNDFQIGIGIYILYRGTENNPLKRLTFFITTSESCNKNREKPSIALQKNKPETPIAPGIDGTNK